jgi:hypothetical protein
MKYWSLFWEWLIDLLFPTQCWECGGIDKARNMKDVFFPGAYGKWVKLCPKCHDFLFKPFSKDQK